MYVRGLDFYLYFSKMYFHEMSTFNKKRFKPFEINVLKLSLMKKYGFPLREINLLIASINVSVVKSVTNSRCVHRAVAQVNTNIYALNSSADFEYLSRICDGPA